MNPISLRKCEGRGRERMSLPPLLLFICNVLPDIIVVICGIICICVAFEFVLEGGEAVHVATPSPSLSLSFGLLLFGICGSHATSDRELLAVAMK